MYVSTREPLGGRKVSRILVFHCLKIGNGNVTHARISEVADTVGKGEAISVTDRGGSLGCETPRLTHFLDNRHTDGGEVRSHLHAVTVVTSNC
jgi:hypothetical protein